MGKSPGDKSSAASEQLFSRAASLCSSLCLDDIQAGPDKLALLREPRLICADRIGLGAKVSSSAHVLLFTHRDIKGLRYGASSVFVCSNDVLTACTDIMFH